MVAQTASGARALEGKSFERKDLSLQLTEKRLQIELLEIQPQPSRSGLY